MIAPATVLASLPEEAELSPDDVIAYLPPVTPGRDALLIGKALGDGLAQWARYQRVLRQAHRDSALESVVRAEVLAGDFGTLQALLDGRETTLAPRQPDAGGVYRTTDAEGILLRLRVKRWTAPGGKLCLGVVACSNDGNVFALWPPGEGPNVGVIGDDEATFLGTRGAPPPEQVFHVGTGKRAPLGFTIREDQTSSLYTLKVFAAVVGLQDPAIDVGALALDDDVQQVINASIPQAATRGLIGRDAAPPTPAVPLWYTWDLPVAVRRAPS